MLRLDLVLSIAAIADTIARTVTTAGVGGNIERVEAQMPLIWRASAPAMPKLPNKHSCKEWHCYLTDTQHGIFFP